MGGLRSCNRELNSQRFRDVPDAIPLVPRLDQPKWFLFALPTAGPIYKTVMEKARWGAVSQTVNG